VAPGLSQAPQPRRPAPHREQSLVGGVGYLRLSGFVMTRLVLKPRHFGRGFFLFSGLEALHRPKRGFISAPLCRCVSVPAQVWALSSRAYHRPRRCRLPVPAGCTKSSMTASASWRGGGLLACSSLPAMETRFHAPLSVYRNGGFQTAGPLMPDRR